MAAEGEIEDLPCSRDLLRRFSGEETAPEVGGGELREVELSLGLSLGGCFGDAKEKGLVRSSSLSMFPPENHHHQLAGGIARTVSMPAETEEEWRRRKEMQSLKRMEAKRKRWEKRAKERKGEEEEEEEEEDLASAAAGPPPKEEKVAAAVTAATAAVGALRWAGTGKPASQGSIGSQGSSSSGVSDFESKPLLGLDASRLNISVEVRCPSIPLVLEHAGNSSTMLNKLTNPPKEEDEPSKKRKIITARSSGVKEMERSMMEEMPCVSTRGDGPNGRRIEGFLYKYRKGEEVRIVCVCHGSFLTPAEFVKHAGGGDVDHPLRHIVVSPNPCGLL